MKDQDREYGDPAKCVYRLVPLNLGLHFLPQLRDDDAQSALGAQAWSARPPWFDFYQSPWFRWRMDLKTQPQRSTDFDWRLNLPFLFYALGCAYVALFQRSQAIGGVILMALFVYSVAVNFKLLVANRPTLNRWQILLFSGLGVVLLRDAIWVVLGLTTTSNFFRTVTLTVNMISILLFVIARPDRFQDYLKVMFALGAALSACLLANVININPHDAVMAMAPWVIFVLVKRRRIGIVILAVFSAIAYALVVRTLLYAILVTAAFVLLSDLVPRARKAVASALVVAVGLCVILLATPIKNNAYDDGLNDWLTYRPVLWSYYLTKERTPVEFVLGVGDDNPMSLRELKGRVELYRGRGAVNYSPHNMALNFFTEEGAMLLTVVILSLLMISAGGGAFGGASAILLVFVGLLNSVEFGAANPSLIVTALLFLMPKPRKDVPG
ncbi:hypothetical protein ACN2C7_06460 [Caulobacter sp. ErkDOM-E]|uniref:hypothetical protein n=1 Tax=Caulobacter sp. ErkDOM-E TaxID=3402778 RepID=UPI003AF9BB5E